MRKLKAGIVGCGGIANGKHLPAMKKSGLYEIVASVTSSESVQRKQKKNMAQKMQKYLKTIRSLSKRTWMLYM